MKQYSSEFKKQMFDITDQNNAAKFDNYIKELEQIVQADLQSKGVSVLDANQQSALSDGIRAYHDDALKQGTEASSLLAMYKAIEAAGFSPETKLQIRVAVSESAKSLETTKLAAELGKGGMILMTDPAGQRYAIEDDVDLSGTISKLMGKSLPDSIAKAENASQVRAETKETVHAQLKGMPPRVVAAADAYLAYRFQDESMSSTKAATSFIVASLDIKQEAMRPVMDLVDSAIEQHLGSQSRFTANVVQEEIASNIKHHAVQI